MSYLKQVNWLDIFAVILLIRITYISIKTGFPTEIFKLFGNILAIYLACHNYIKVSNSLQNLLPVKAEAAINFLQFIAFFALACLGYLIFVVIRIVIKLFIKMEAVSIVNRWGAFIFGLVRWGLFTSLLFFSITIIKIGYFENSLADSLLGPRLFKLTPKVYVCLWNNLASHFEDKEQFNQEVLQ